MADLKEGTRVLVTGASGYIATRIVKKLQEQGYNVRGTVRSTSNEKRLNPLKTLCPGARYELELKEVDLLDPVEKWVDVVRGCQYVLHTANPVVLGYPKEEEVVTPALTGTLNVLQACKEAGGVKRVVLTSSTAAVGGGFAGGHYDQSNWTDLTRPDCQPYSKAKTLAEKKAREFVNDTKDIEFDLVTINPAVVVGPILCGTLTSSSALVKGLLDPKSSRVPKSNFPMVHIDDVTDLHLLAMTTPEASGGRYIAYSGSMWMIEIASLLKKEFGPMGYILPDKEVPTSLLWLTSFFSEQAKTAYSLTSSAVNSYDNGPMLSLLGREARDIKHGLVEMAHSAIQAELLEKKSGYKPPEMQGKDLQEQE